MQQAPWMHTRPQWAHPNSTQIPAKPWRYVIVDGRKFRYSGAHVEVRRKGRNRWKPASREMTVVVLAALGEVRP